MGASTFSNISHGKSAQEAFRAAVSEAQFEHGNDGYSGSIAEKSEFVRIKVASKDDPYQVMKNMLDNNDRRVSDKWGPCGCIEITGTTYAISNHPGISKDKRSFLFFGWASE